MATDYDEPDAEYQTTIPPERIFGLMAEFEDPDDLLAAVRLAREEGYREMDAYTPFPIDGLAEALEMGPTRLPLIILGGAILGAAGAFFMQYYASAIDYPLNVGGRPLNSWPAFIPITFELAILVAAFTAILGMFALNGLPQPYHPVFNVPSFELASRSHFFLNIESRDRKFDLSRTRSFLESLNPTQVSIVEL